MAKPTMQSTLIKRGIAKLREEGMTVEPFETGKVILGDHLQYVLTHAELLDLMGKDQPKPIPSRSETLSACDTRSRHHRSPHN